MVGETWDNWRENIRKTLELSPESVTIYQMELPFNTVFSKDILGNQVESPVADWDTKRAWVQYAFNEFKSRRLQRQQRLHGRQRSEQGELQLSRQSLARGRSAGHRDCQLWTCQWRALSEPGRAGTVLGSDRGGSIAAGSRLRPHAIINVWFAK